MTEEENENREENAANAEEEDGGQETERGDDISVAESAEGTHKKPKKSIGKIVKRTFTAVGFGVLALLVLLVGWLCIDKYILKSPAPSIFGYSSFIVSTGSMSGMIEEGDLVIVKNTGDYEIGDVITFLHEGEQTPTTHMIFEILKDESGNTTGYITRGVANNAYDPAPVTEDEIFGEVVSTIPRLGLFFTWIKTEGGWVYLIGIILIVAVGIFLYHRFVKEKSEVAEGPQKKDGDASGEN